MIGAEASDSTRYVGCENPFVPEIFKDGRERGLSAVPLVFSNVHDGFLGLFGLEHRRSSRKWKGFNRKYSLQAADLDGTFQSRAAKRDPSQSFRRLVYGS